MANTDRRVSTLATVIASLAAGVWLSFALVQGAQNLYGAGNSLLRAALATTALAALLIAYTLYANRRATKGAA